MKITKIHTTNLRNDEHFQYILEFINLVYKFSAETLKIAPLFATLLSLFALEDKALKKIMKSVLTLDLQDLDKRRDRLFRGIADMNRVALNHFNEKVQEASKRLKILLDTYGNIARKPMNEATSAIFNLLQELNGKYAADVTLVGLTEWVKELHACNSAFDKLMKTRYEETAMRTDLVLKDCRQDVDNAYHDIVEHINACVIIEGDAKYADFIRNLNVVIDKYMAILAHRRGHHAHGEHTNKPQQTNNNN
jgi:hypothetical protein